MLLIQKRTNLSHYYIAIRVTLLCRGFQIRLFKRRYLVGNTECCNNRCCNQIDPVILAKPFLVLVNLIIEFG